MSEIKLVLADIDGTLVNFGKHVVSEKVRQAVIECENSGVRVVPVTGRSHSMSRPVLELLGFDGPGVFDNGATIQDIKGGKIVWRKWLNPALARKIATALYPYSVLLFYEPGITDVDVHETDENELNRIAIVDEPVTHVYALVHNRDVAKVSDILKLTPDVTYYFAPSFDETKTDY